MVTLKQIQVSPGEGLKRTLDEMILLENISIKNQSFVNWVFKNFSSDCAGCLPGKVWNYMIDNFKYQDDLTDEVLIAPHVMLNLKAGDCDDFSLFAKTIIDIIGGFYTHYLLLGKDRFKYTHIVVFVHRGKANNNFVDPVIVDGMNHDFNLIDLRYNFYKII